MGCGKFNQMVTHWQDELKDFFGSIPNTQPDQVPMLIWLQEHSLVPSTSKLVENGKLSHLIDCVRSILSTQVFWDKTCSDTPPLSVFEAWQQWLPLMPSATKGKRICDAEYSESEDETGGPAERKRLEPRRVGSSAKLAHRPASKEPKAAARSHRDPGQEERQSRSPRRERQRRVGSDDTGRKLAQGHGDRGSRPQQLEKSDKASRPIAHPLGERADGKEMGRDQVRRQPRVRSTDAESEAQAQGKGQGEGT